MLRKRNSYPAVAENEIDINGAKRDKKDGDDDDDDDDEEEINVVDLSDSELDDQKPQTSTTKSSFSVSNPEDLKQLSAVKFRDTSCRPLDLSKKSKSNSPTANGVKTKSWPANFGLVSDNRQTSSPFVLNQVRPTVIRSADVCFDHQELPDVDEHFRKSLGPQPAPNEADAKVDDHFARALGNMWWELKRQEANSPSVNTSLELNNSSSASTRSSSSR